jgi:hypothetical protein
MKRLSILMVCFATLVLTSCGALNTSSNSAAQAMGQTCGAAVLGLYQSYKATGTINLTTGNNLTNALALATCYTQLKANKDNKAYRSSFTNGLILSSAGLITNQNASTFVNALLSANGLANLNANSTQQQNKAATTSMNNLLKTL